jgi:hypothetical protein
MKHTHFKTALMLLSPKKIVFIYRELLWRFCDLKTLLYVRTRKNFIIKCKNELKLQKFSLREYSHWFWTVNSKMRNLSSSETAERNFSLPFFNTQLLKTFFIIHNSLIKREKNLFVLFLIWFIYCQKKRSYIFFYMFLYIFFHFKLHF